VKRLAAMAREFPVSVVQLIYRANAWEGGSRDYEFSARTMAEHWEAGRDAVSATIDKSAVIAQNIGTGRTAVFDLTPR
jgi:NTE family protein